MSNRPTAADDERFMARALELAARGEGLVEPNPLVGCVLVRDGEIVGEGWHQRFGGPHAEVVALADAGDKAAASTAYVTLEPCCHHGKTPPCTEALLQAGVARLVAAAVDPYPEVSGAGIEALRNSGIECTLGVLKQQARRLNAPYRRLLHTGLPWIIAKWAMSRDGRIATPLGESPWISNHRSREIVQCLRGRVDAIVVGSNTARLDDPLLMARPADPTGLRRVATRVVVDSSASLALDSQLVRTAADAPVLVAVAEDAPAEACERLAGAGVEVFRCAGAAHADRLGALLDELGRRRMTNVLVEGGGRLLKAVFDMRAVDEVHLFVAPREIGGQLTRSPIIGNSAAEIAAALGLPKVDIEEIDGDTYYHARLQSPSV